MALVALLAVVGCASPEPTPLTPVSTRVRGELSASVGGYAFQLCGSKSRRPVADRTHGDLPSLWHTLGVDSTMTLFVVAFADTGGDSVAVTSIRRAQAGEGRFCDEDWSYLWRAHGNEPFWSITVTRAGIVFEQPDEPRRIEFPYVEPIDETYRTAAAGDTLVLRLEDRRCQDGMSGFIFPLTAEARLNGRVLHGCASEGAP